MTNVMVESVHFDACEELNGMVSGGINFEKGPIRVGMLSEVFIFTNCIFFQNSPWPDSAHADFSAPGPILRSEMRGGRSKLRMFSLRRRCCEDRPEVDPSSECLLLHPSPVYVAYLFMFAFGFFAYPTALRQRQQGVRQRREQKGRQRTKVAPLNVD